jgi:hypothetical protein
MHRRVHREFVDNATAVRELLYIGRVVDWDEDARTRLRIAANRRNGRQGLDALTDRPLAPVLQLAGDVLLSALGQNEPGAERLARQCAEELKKRGHDGDAELAAELLAALDGTQTGLAEVPVDLGTLGSRLAADPSEGVQVLDLRTGDIDEPGQEFDAESEEYDPDRWLTFMPGGGEPSDEDGQRGRARQWLAAHGYRPGPRPFL